jgi:hypothetical protein
MSLSNLDNAGQIVGKLYLRDSMKKILGREYIELLSSADSIGVAILILTSRKDPGIGRKIGNCWK